MKELLPAKGDNSEQSEQAMTVKGCNLQLIFQRTKYYSVYSLYLIAWSLNIAVI